MEKQKLPNATLILICGITSVLTCCCCGIIGIPIGIIALVLANQSTKLYLQAPEQFEGIGNVKLGRVLAIIGIILNVLYLVYSIYSFSSVGVDGILEQQYQIFEDLGIENY